MKRLKHKHIITSINSIRFLFELNGLKLEDTNSSDNLKYRIIYAFNFTWLNFDGIGELIWFCDGIWSSEHFVKLAAMFPCVIMCFLSNIKMILHNLNEKKVADLINSFKELEDDEFINDTDADDRSKEKIYEEEMKYLEKIVKIVKVLNVVTVIAFGIAPFLLMGAHYLETKEFMPVLPFYVKYYLFDPYNMKYYGLLYLHQFWSMCICLIGILGVDMLFCTMCVFIKIHFKLLEYDFERFIPIHTTPHGCLRENETITRRFKWLVKKHQKVISCSNLLNRIHSNEFMMNFFTSSFLICLSAFIITVVEEMRFRISFLSFLVTSLQQLFLLCFFGDMVMTCSINLSGSIYSSLWHSVKCNIGKQLSYALQRSQKPCKITAGGFIDVNLIVFTQIIGKTWTLFALLRTIFNP
uniref:Odorant receptor n=1 Tax=Histia rhodope TaxID=1453155 RepID=A0A7G4KBV0_9NEOP|nr:odorant receptor [Histia rhodope]